MTNDATSRRSRHAFTLVEMLTVIIIIGILASLMLVAFGAARTRTRVATIKMEASQLDMALENYRQKYGEYPPDFSGVGYPNVSGSSAIRDDGRQRVLRHLRKRFPRYSLTVYGSTVDLQWRRFAEDVWNATSDYDGNGTPDQPYPGDLANPNVIGGGLYVTEFDPRAALVFWLAGLPEVGPRAPATYRRDPADPASDPRAGNLVGFSANPASPFTRGGNRVQPLFDFNLDRLGYAKPAFNQLAVPQYNERSVPIYGSFCVNRLGGDLVVYPNGTRTVAAPYVYFRGSTTNGYVTLYDFRPYYDTRSNRWVDLDKFQIISAGLDGGFGAIASSTASPYGAYYPTGDNFVPDSAGGEHLDNISNFTVSATIKDDMP